MAIKQRLLNQLMDIENRFDYSKYTYGSIGREIILRQLILARDLCRDGLSEIDYHAYAESYNVMIEAVEQVLEDNDGSLSQKLVPMKPWNTQSKYQYSKVLLKFVEI